MSRIAFIFPGQGAQKAGMGKDFYENSKTAAEVIDRASELLGLDMKALCFEENDLLDQTEYTQAALVTVCMAMEKVLRERGLAPDVTAGLSLGEYCAIASAGGMSTENAITTVRKRGILMQNAVPGGQGAMAAVLGLDAGKIEEVLADRSGVMIANYNCPGQIVITGWKEDVEQAADALKEAGAKRVLPLNVSGPFHSSLLEQAGIILLLLFISCCHNDLSAHAGYIEHTHKGTFNFCAFLDHHSCSCGVQSHAAVLFRYLQHVQSHFNTLFYDLLWIMAFFFPFQHMRLDLFGHKVTDQLYQALLLFCYIK